MKLTLAGKAKEGHSGFKGSYILRETLVNGYPCWLKTGNGSQEAIWFSRVGSAWLVGSKDNLGTKYGRISGPDGKDSYPNEIKQGWRYAENDAWHNAGPNDVIFKSIGLF